MITRWLHNTHSNLLGHQASAVSFSSAFLRIYQAEESMWSWKLPGFLTGCQCLESHRDFWMGWRWSLRCKHQVKCIGLSAMWKIFLNYIFRIIYYYVCIRICLCIYIHTTFTLGFSRYQKRLVDSPELESQIVVVHMGALKQIQVLCVSSHFFRPYVGIFFYLTLREMGNHRAVYFYFFEKFWDYSFIYMYLCVCVPLHEFIHTTSAKTSWSQKREPESLKLDF